MTTLGEALITLLEARIARGWVHRGVRGGALVPACGLLVMGLLPD